MSLPNLVDVQSLISAAWGAVGGVVMGYVAELFRTRNAKVEAIEDLALELGAEAKAYWFKDGPDSALEAQIVRLTHRFQQRTNKFARMYLASPERGKVYSKLSTILPMCTGGAFATADRERDPKQIASLSMEIENLLKFLRTNYYRGTLKHCMNFRGA